MLPGTKDVEVTDSHRFKAVQPGEGLSILFADVFLQSVEELSAGGDVVPASRHQAVHYSNLLIPAKQSLGQVRSDKPRAACYQPRSHVLLNRAQRYHRHSLAKP